MKLADLFSSHRPTERLNVPTIVFIGEQDGPPERTLKRGLSELFRGCQNVLRAYLARVHYENPKDISVCLCLSVNGPADEPLLEAIRTLFAQQFNHAVHLDIVFLKPKQEDQLTKVCKPFYGP